MHSTGFCQGGVKHEGIKEEKVGVLKFNIKEVVNILLHSPSAHLCTDAVWISYLEVGSDAIAEPLK